MNRHVNAIAGRLSLRPPQRHSLEILDRITEIVPPHKAADLAASLEIGKEQLSGKQCGTHESAVGESADTASSYGTCAKCKWSKVITCFDG